MKKKSKTEYTRRVFGARSVAVIVALALIFTVAVGTTVALLIWKSDKDTSKFEAAKADCRVVESGGSYSVKNSGDTDVYIRACFTVSWKNENGEIYGKKQPEQGSDYDIAINTNDWFLGDDGYYYCKLPIAAGEQTAALIDSFVPTDAAYASSGNASGEFVFPDYYVLTVDMAASAIQCEPENAVEDYWRVSVDGSGSLRK